MALDLDDLPPPREILDHQVTIGSRTVKLPPGHWFYIDSWRKVVTGGPQDHLQTTEDAAILAQVEDRQLVLGVRLGMLRSDVWRLGWGFTCPGPRADVIYLRTWNTNQWQADCVAIYGRRSSDFRALASADSTSASVSWLAQAGVRLPVTSVSVSYSRFATNTYGWIWMLVPTERFDSDAGVTAWAESLRTALKPLFERRVDAAQIPALPTPEVAGDPASAPTPAAATASGAGKGSP